MFEGSFPPLLGVEQFENRLPPAFPGIQGEGESEGSSIEGALLYWPEGELFPQITCLSELPSI